MTDHKPLQWLFNCKDPGSRLVRWRLKLEEFEYDILYKKGKTNTNADALSRFPVNPVQPTDPPTSNPPIVNPSRNLDEDLIDLLISPPSFNPDEAISPPLDLAENASPLPYVDLPSNIPDTLREEIENESINLPQPEPEQITSPEIQTDNVPFPSTSSSPDVPVDDYSTFLKSMSCKDRNFNTEVEEHNETLMKCPAKVILVPTSIDLNESNPYIQEILTDPEIIAEIHESEKELFSFKKIETNNKCYYLLFIKVHHFDEASYPEIFQTLKTIRNELINSEGIKELGISDLKNPFEKHSFIKIYNILCYLFHDTQIKININHNNIIYPAPAEIKKILLDNHNIPIAGHLGSVRMYNRIKQSYYWKGMRSDIESYVKQCKSCQENKALRKTNRAPMQITSTSTEPRQRISLDIVGPLPEAGPAKLRFILTIQDDSILLCISHPKYHC
ncbi:unnamed protein product [Parnassius apollo]|uniref:RNA-directed DNA polymerase n=1 Tax=Parnassius apollo TaxID=110799 RepID=A0A8S3WWT0_PARAO|nr:unnamed protein product [Parnassius apollo]